MTGFYTEYQDTSGVHVSSAEAAAEEADASKIAAAASATAAATAETNAETAETNAATSATNAATSETNAATSATNAATSATTASTKAGEAAASASNTATSETAAATSATNAATSATNAASSATASATAETNAETAETNAETAETNAASSATASASSASTASTQATNASNSASAAATSATNAGNSETAAATSATNAASSQTAAASSASTASSSATTATTKAGEAATSATNSATSATNSSNSATSAGTAQTAAEAARDAALAAFDSFDDRYLGQKSVDPTVDNDGNALVAGTLYFNTTDDIMKVYEGSAWVAAYASLSGALLATNNLSDLNNAGTARTNLGLGTAATTAATAYATAAQGTKVDGIEAGADVTDTANVTAAGALMDSELTSIASVKALNQGVATGDSPAFAGLTVDTTTLAVDSTNNRVGIGTSSPSSPLTVSGEAKLGLIANPVRINSSATTGIVEFSSSGAGVLRTLGSVPLTLQTNSAERMRIDSSGNVGIGTDSPDTLMEIASTSPVLRITNTTNSTWSTGQDIGRLSFYSTDASAVGPHETAFILNEADSGSNATQLSGALSFGAAAYNTAATEAMRITSGGEFLVGKTSTSTAIVGCSINSAGTIYTTQDVVGLVGGISLRNNSGTDSIVGVTCYNGLASINTSASTGGGHSLSIRGALSGEYARFTSAKRLGIGTTAPAQSLHVVGSIVATGNITAYYSDERLKDFKGKIDNPLEKLNTLNGYYFKPNETALLAGAEQNGLEVGVSAQEVEKVLPEIVSPSALGKDYKTVSYEKLTPLLIEAVKELSAKVDDLELRLQNLEK